MTHPRPCRGCWTLCPSCEVNPDEDPPEFEDMDPADEDRIDEIDEGNSP